LILATGAQTAYFGNDDWADLAPGLKSVEDALEIRRRILCAYEAAERLPNGSPEFAEYLTFVIVGGGPTGVEMAGAIAEIARQTLKNDFRTINPADTRVILIQSGPRVLAEYNEKLSESARRQLEHLGVEVRTGPRVTDIENHEVVVGDEVIRARTILWTAGITASPVAKSLNVPLDKGGRVLVQPDLSVPGYPEAFVVGDLANFPHQTGEPLPGLAPIAVKEGEAAARNILNTISGRARRKFHYRDKGSMATIGRGSAVAQFGRFSLSGFPAWLAWLFIHIYFLIGFYNSVVIIFRWGWSYFTSNRGARLITGPLCQSPLLKTPEVVPNDRKHPSLSMPPLEPIIVDTNGTAPK
ncbi:MAG: hypothetical protein JWN98_320, partial [Abditibacteriota bacterium]|nr:hypothetical protein [Abditibacteriota bacterium]